MYIYTHAITLNIGDFETLIAFADADWRSMPLHNSAICIVSLVARNSGTKTGEGGSSGGIVPNARAPQEHRHWVVMLRKGLHTVYDLLFKRKSSRSLVRFTWQRNLLAALWACCGQPAGMC